MRCALTFLKMERKLQIAWKTCSWFHVALCQIGLNAEIMLACLFTIHALSEIAEAHSLTLSFSVWIWQNVSFLFRWFNMIICFSQNYMNLLLGFWFDPKCFKYFGLSLKWSCVCLDFHAADLPWHILHWCIITMVMHPNCLDDHAY